MSKTVFLHIGAHKTGTTAVQYTAFRNRNTLLGQGIDYPMVCWSGVAHHRLPVGLAGRAIPRMPGPSGPGPVIDDLTAAIEASPCARVLISSEALFKTPEPALVPLAEALRPYDTRILLTLRRPDAMYLSSYHQRSKDPFDGFQAALRDYLDQPWRVAGDTRFFTRMSIWARQFGADAMRVFLFENADTVQQILRCVGADVPTASDPTARNAAQSIRLSETMLWAKRRGLPLGARRVLYSASVRLLHDGPRYTLSREDRMTILQAALPETENAFACLGRPNPYRPEILDADETVAAS